METVLVDSDEKLLELLPKFANAPQIAIDTETTGLHWKDHIIIGMCLSVDGETGYYIPFGHEEGPQCSFPVVSYVVEIIVRNPRSMKIFHNAKFDRHHILSTFRFEVVPPIQDTMAAFFVHDNTAPKDLKGLSADHFDYGLVEAEQRKDRALDRKGVSSMVFLSPGEVSDYGAGDALYTFKLWELVRHWIRGHWGLYRTEVELLDFVMMMERRGCLIDRDFLLRQGEVLAEELPRIERELNEAVGHPINARSPTQVGDYLFRECGFKPTHWTKTGRPATSEDVLLNLPPSDIIDLILRVRTVGKILRTYVEGINEKLTPAGRLHGKFNSMGADTGRFSSSEPNLQNIPREGSVPVSIRQAFIPTPGYLLVFLDYRQVEMRLFAHYANDPQLLELVHAGFDFHLGTASVVYSKEPEDVTKEERKWVKRINFGYIYGIGERKLARQLKVSRREARAFLDNYDHRFPGVPVFMRKCRNDYEERGFVENLFGRRRYIPMDKAYRAVNTLIQGTAADLLKNSMVRLTPLMRSTDVHPIIQVHDELIFEVPLHQLGVVREIQSTMEAFHLRVPVDADIQWSDLNWGMKKPWNLIEAEALDGN